MSNSPQSTLEAENALPNAPTDGNVAVGASDGGPQAIIATDLQKQYGGRLVVDHVSIEVRRGEVVGLLGPNGAGKTTSFYMIMGLVKPNGGMVKLGSQEITNWPMHRRAHGGMGYLAQDASVFRKLTVEQNLLAILELMPLSSTQRMERCEQLMDDLDLLPRRHAKGISLSGGERRRTEIARTLATNPYFILLDEPFTGVDPLVRQEIQRIVIRLKNQGIGVLITDHNEYDTLEIIDRGYILSGGQVITQGSAHELINDPRARAAYFGEKIGSHSSR